MTDEQLLKSYKIMVQAREADEPIHLLHGPEPLFYKKVS